MTWWSSLLVALLAGALGLLCGGVVMGACVQWYRVSSFEGKAGYAIVAMALLGGLAGAIVGLVCARLVAGWPEPGFLKALGLGWGSVLALAGIAAGIARLLADVPPTLDGQELVLEVEVRLPVTVAAAPAPDAAQHLELGSVVGGVQRSRSIGELRPADARREDGRWIVPGSVAIHTGRGARSLGMRLGDGEPFGFLIPLPARPGHEHERWSDWYPRPPAGEPPWPDDRPSVRYRVAKLEPPPPEPDPAEARRQLLAALAPDAPLAEWLALLDVDTPEESVGAIQAEAARRPAELAALIRSSDVVLRERALGVVVDLETVAPEVAEAVAAEGRDLADALAAFNALPEDDPGFYQVQVELRSRFAQWKRAWWTTFHRLGLDGRPPVQALHDLAAVRAQGTSMDEIVIGARAILDALGPP